MKGKQAGPRQALPYPSASRHSGTEPALLASLLETDFQIVPQGRTARLDRWSDTAYHTRMADAVFAPALALVGQVQQYRHGPVRGMGETRFRRVPGLELLPQCQKCRALLFRQHPENPLPRRQLGRLALF